MKSKASIWLLGSALALMTLTFLAVVSLRSPHYSALIPFLRLGQSRAEIKAQIQRLRLDCEDDPDGMYVGKVTPLNLFQKEHRLVLCFDKADTLTQAYEDIMFRYDDVGSRDVKIGRSPTGVRRH